MVDAVIPVERFGLRFFVGVWVFFVFINFSCSSFIFWLE
jgi:hypothetical protein